MKRIEDRSLGFMKLEDRHIKAIGDAVIANNQAGYRMESMEGMPDKGARTLNERTILED